MKKLFNYVKNKNYLIYLLFFCFTLIYLFFLKQNGHNIWVDFNGLIDISSNFNKSLFVWNENILGYFQYQYPSNLPIFFIIRAIYHTAGLSYGTYLIWFIITYLNLITSFLLFSKLSSNKFHSILLSIFFITSPIYLHNFILTGTLGFMFAFPGFFLGFYNYFKFKENYRPVNLIGIIVSSLFVTHPFLFFFYCLIFGFLLLKNKLLKDLLLLALGIIGFNSFWILPFVSSMIYKAPKIMGSYTQKLISTFSDLSSYQNSFLFMGKSFDSIQKIFNKGAIFIIISTLLLTVILFYSISVKKVKYEKFLLVILFVLLIFSIGPRPPFGFIYSFLESNVSFFVYFRSFQNALIPAYIIFLILITYSLNTDKKTRMIISLLLFIQIFSFFIFLNPLIINKGNEIPNNYFQLKQLMDSDNTTNRILLLPTSMYDYYKWDEGIENSDRYFLEAFFNKKGVSFYRPTLDNKTLEGIYSEIYNNPESGIQLAKENGIKYILIRKDLLFENKNYYKKFNYDLNNLNKLMDNDNFVLYEIDKTKSYVNSSGNLNFIKLSPVEIDLEINNLQKDTISLLEANYQGWKLFIEKYNENTLCKEGINKECLNDKLDKVSFSSIQLINKTNVPKNNSENDYINTWDLNKDYVVKNYSNKYYRLNNDGSINVKAKIYFVPQIFLYLGIILSLFFYVLAFLYVVLNNKIKDEN